MAVAFLALAGGAVPTYGQPPVAITIAWDANQEPGVLGYVVYVGTASGAYTSTHDVGHRTSFTYPAALQGRRYYFAVAAYTAGKLIGPRSSEISGIAGTVPFASVSGAFVSISPALSRSNAPAAPGAESTDPTEQPLDAARRPGAPVICDAAPATACYARRVRAAGLSSIAALAAAPDGRVFAVENGEQLRVIDGTGRAGGTYVALRIGHPRTRLGGVAVDPDFRVTGFVFVGLTDTGADGTRQLSIVRYRDVQNRLGEPVVVVAGLPLTGSGAAAFAVGPGGRVYVAMPADGPGRRDPYAGYVLWFNVDGSLPSGSRGGSPVLAHGYPHPLGIAATRDGVWLVGGPAGWSAAMARVQPIIGASASWPLVPVVAPLPVPVGNAAELAPRTFNAAPGGAAADGGAVIVDTAGRLRRLRVSPQDGSTRIETLAWADGQRASAAAVGEGQALYVALEQVDGTFVVEELSAAGGAPADKR